MHKFFASILLILFSLSFSQSVQNFTITDINGDNHNLFSYLDQGKYVIVDVTVLD